MLELLRQLQAEMGTAVILITHDLGVVAETCDEVAVMYAGELVERAPVAELFARPQHPYTVGLIGSLPRLSQRRVRLVTIPGTVPTLSAQITGCRFAPRCPFVEAACRATAPQLTDCGEGHLSRCRRAPLERLVA
jgi:peptide/nickel transport system ATP-binding protein